MDKNAVFICAVVGPTAAGKTDLAVDLARHNRGEIISFDSMQIYRDAPIATAVPTPEPVSEPDPPAAPEQTPEPSEPAMGPADTPVLPGGTGGSNQNAGTLDRLLPIIIIAGAAVLIVLTICITLIVLSKNRRRGRRN